MRLTRDEIRQVLAANGLDHLSYSAVQDLLKDPRLFRKKWMEGDFDAQAPVAVVEGRAYHAGLQAFWEQRKAGITDRTDLAAAAYQAAHERLEHDSEPVEVNGEKVPGVTWGRMRIAAKAAGDFAALGSEITTEPDRNGKTITYASQNINVSSGVVDKSLFAYIEQAMLDDRLPVEVEIAHTALPDDVEMKELHLLPTKGKMDKLDYDPETNTVTVTDYKLQGQEPETDEETGLPVVTPAFRIQASCYEPIVRDLLPVLLGEKAKDAKIKFVFDLMNKKTQTRTLVECELTEADRVIWARLLRGAILTIAVNCMIDDTATFLPNPFQAYGNDGWDAFKADVDAYLGIKPPAPKPAAAPKIEPYEFD